MIEFSKIKKASNYSLLFKTAMLFFFVFSAAFLLLIYPEQAGNGVKKGMQLCFCVVVPSLYPFMVLSNFFVDSSLCRKLSRVFEKPTRLVFALPGEIAGVLLLSLVGGFPVGASMTAALYKSRQISREVGQRLLLFCVCPGPAFVIGAVGSNMLSSKKAGMVIYASLVLSSLMIGFLTRLIYDADFETLFFAESNKIQLSKAFADSVSKSTATMISVCGWILLFSSLIELLTVSPFSDNTRLALASLLEVTSAVKLACGRLSLPVIAGMIGWGGLSTHFQIMPFVKSLGLKIKLFWSFRLINGALTALICQLILRFYPIEEAVVSQSSAKLSPSQGSSVFLSVSMFAMCVLFLLGNDYVIRRKEKTNS